MACRRCYRNSRWLISWLIGLCRSFERLSCWEAAETDLATCWSKRRRLLQWHVRMRLWSAVTWSRPGSSTTTSSWRSRPRFWRSKRLFRCYCRSGAMPSSVSIAAAGPMQFGSSWLVQNCFCGKQLNQVFYLSCFSFFFVWCVLL